MQNFGGQIVYGGCIEIPFKRYVEIKQQALTNRDPGIALRIPTLL